MKILFLQNNLINESLALCDLAGLLKFNDYSYLLLVEKEEKNFYQKIIKYQPTLVIIPISIIAPIWGLDTGIKLKKILPSTLLLAAGTYPTFFPEMIEKNPFDIILRGEAEQPILTLLSKLKNKQDITKIRNLWVREGNTIYKNPLGEFTNISELPIPDREIYFKYPVARNFPLKIFASGRGCPNNCNYCFNAGLKQWLPNIEKFTRKKPVPKLINEIKDVQKKKYLMTHIHFSDDLFTFDKEWVKEFCLQYQKNFEIPFTINSKAEFLNETLIKTLKKAGCRGIAIGIESGNEKLRMTAINRPTTNKIIIDACQLVKKHKLILTTFNMLNLPTEETKNLWETIEINHQLKVDNPRATIFFSIPKTKIYEKFGSATKTTAAIEIIYHLFPLFVKYPRLAKKILPFIGIKPLLPFWCLAGNIKNFYEKKFFKINLLKSINYYLRTGGPKNKTHVYSTLL